MKTLYMSSTLVFRGVGCSSAQPYVELLCVICYEEHSAHVKIPGFLYGWLQNHACADQEAVWFYGRQFCTAKC